MRVLPTTWTGRYRLLLLVVGLASCDRSKECCIDGASQAVLEGSVTDASGLVAPGVSVETTGHRYDCGLPMSAMGFAEGRVVSEADGTFTLSLNSFLGGPGDYCVSLVATPPGDVPDTLPDIAVQFFDGPVLDTTVVLVSLD